MDLEGASLDLEGALLHRLPKSGEPWPLWPPGSYVPDILKRTSLKIKDQILFSTEDPLIPLE